MWIHSGDQAVIENKTFEVVAISGLYSASQVTISLKNLETQEVITMPYVSEFMRKYEAGEIKVNLLTKKVKITFNSSKVAA